MSPVSPIRFGYAASVLGTDQKKVIQYLQKIHMENGEPPSYYMMTAGHDGYYLGNYRSGRHILSPVLGEGTTECKDELTITTWPESAPHLTQPADNPAEEAPQQKTPEKPEKPHWIFRIPLIGRVLKWIFGK